MKGKRGFGNFMTMIMFLLFLIPFGVIYMAATRSMSMGDPAFDSLIAFGLPAVVVMVLGVWVLGLRQQGV